MDVTALLIKLLDFFGKKRVITYNADSGKGSLSMKVDVGEKIVSVCVNTEDKKEETNNV